MSDWLTWQVVDSAFPTGAFAHSFGLEAAWQHGEVDGPAALGRFLRASVLQAGHAVLPLLNTFARIPICGTIANYNDTAPPPGPDRLPAVWRMILTKRLSVRGLLVTDFAALHDDFLRDVSGWMREGRIKVREDVVEGFENAPRALIGLLRGENFGKLLVRVAERRS